MEGDGPALLAEKFLRTIPQNLESLIGANISLTSEEPRDVIELLGQALGITDYKSNPVSFWFLDVLALQLLRHKEDLDDHSRSLLISWLSGEMLLIRDRKLRRENFFGQMENIFVSVADRISAGGTLLYWDELVPRNIGEPGQTEEEDLSEGEPSSPRKSLEQRLSKGNQNLSPIPGQSATSGSIDLRRVLNIIIDCTYDMYSSELRYALVYEIFVEQVQLQTYQIPFLLRKPRPVRISEADAQAVENRHEKPLINRTYSGLSIEKPAGKKRKNKKKTRTSQVTSEASAVPTSIINEDLLKAKQSFILPLVEAREAEDIFQGNQNNPEMTDNFI